MGGNPPRPGGAPHGTRLLHPAELRQTELRFRRRQRAEEHDLSLASRDAEPIPEIDRNWLQYIDARTHDRGWQSTSWYIGWLETTERELQRIVEGSATVYEEGRGAA